MRYSLSLIPEQNWNALWESSFEPVVIDGRCTIKASFHKGLPRTKYTIVIDPKMAFGTGHHQTTTLIIKSMLAHEKDIRGLQVLDMGCGTGILSILAAKMKAAVPVHAIDIDPVAVRSARENARRNRVPDRIHTLCGDASLIQAGKYDLILANINRNIILEDLSTYARGMKPGALLITSGFYEEDSRPSGTGTPRLGQPGTLGHRHIPQITVQPIIYFPQNTQHTYEENILPHALGRPPARRSCSSIRRPACGQGRRPPLDEIP